MDRNRLDEFRIAPGDAQDIRHHSSATRAELGESHRGWRPEEPPGVDEPGSGDLAEHLADLRRGDEVAAGAQRVARRVIAVLGIA
jgi:hypothetical protein